MLSTAVPLPRISLWIALLLLIPQERNCETGAPQLRNTQWFEETIDGFLRQAQESGDTADISVSTCKISSQQLVATAQATAARVLKGVCNPNEIEDRFQKLEDNLAEQLSSLKSTLVRLESKLTEQDSELKRQLRRLIQSGSKQRAGSLTNVNGSGGGSTVVDDTSSYSPPYVPSVPHRAQEITEEDEESTGPRYGGPRGEEIARYNSTVHIENGKRVFSYYWVIRGMNTKLTDWSQGRVLRSNPFYVYPGGYRMFLKIIPRYSMTVMYIHAGLTKGEFDDSVPWPFELKMNLAVLNQDRRATTAQDLRSRLWDPKELCSGSNWRKPVFKDNPECVGLGFPHEVLQSSYFIDNDQIVIRLTVYLDN